MLVLKNQFPYHFYAEGDLNKLMAKSEEVPIVLVFAAEWLGTAHILESFLKDIITDFPAVSVYQVDVEKNEELAAQMNISQLPSTFFLKEGEIVDHFSGLIGKKKIRKRLEAIL